MGILDKLINTSGDNNTTSIVDNNIFNFPDKITPSNNIANQIIKESTILNEFSEDYKNIETEKVRINKISNELDILLEYENEKQKRLREEEVAKAKNQSNWAKAFNALERIVVSEIILGSLEGFCNIYDLISEGTNTDYNTALGNWFNNLQQKNNETFAIHRENPNKSWDYSDFGWWAEGLVSVGSFASMLIPAAGTVRVVGRLGKLGKLGKGLNKGLKATANLGNRVQKGKRLLFRPNTAYKNITNVAKQASIATLSRLGESYIESKDTYDFIYDATLKELNNFSIEDKEKFIINNPQYKDMSDEDVASDLAKISADENFSDDMKLVLLDFIQVRGLSKMYQNKLKNIKPNASQRILHRNTMKQLQGLGEESFEKINLFTRSKEWLKYNMKHPLGVLGSLELTEGFEEGYQGIVQDKAKDYYRMAFDPDYTPRTLSSYLSDGAIWEQAFWGVIGGIGIKGLTNISANIKEKIELNKQNKKLTDSKQKEKISNKKIKDAVINERFDRLNDYVEKMQSLNQGVHYSDYEIDENNQVVIENGAPKYKTLTEEEILLEKQKLTNEFLTDFVFNSIESGTFELTKEFIESPYFKEYMKKNGLEENEVDRYINDDISNQINKISEKYNENLQLFLNNIDDPILDNILMAARNVTRLEMDIDSYENINSDIDSAISKLGYDKVFTDGRYNKILNSTIKEAIDYFDEQIENYTKIYNKEKIGKSAYEKYVEDIKRKKLQVYNLLTKQTNLNDEQLLKIKAVQKILDPTKNYEIDNSLYHLFNIFNEINEEFESSNEPLPLDIEEELRKKANNYLRMEMEKTQIPNDKNELVKVYQELLYGFDKYTTERINDAFILVGDYIENSENPEEAYKDLLKEDKKLSNKLKEALEILKLGYESSRDYISDLEDIANSTRAKLNYKNTKNNKVEIDGKEVEEDKKEIIDNNIEELKEDIEKNENEPLTLNPDEEAAINISKEILNEENEGTDVLDETYYTAEEEDYRAKNQISDFIIKHQNKKEFLRLINEIKTADFTDPNYKLVYNMIVNELVKDEGLDISEASLITKQEIYNIFTMIYSNNMEKPDKRQRFNRLAQQLSHNIKINHNEDSFSVTSIIDDTEESRKAKIDLIKEFISSYKELYDITENYLDVDQFFEYLLLNEDINYSTAATIFNYFDFIISENIIPIKNSVTYERYKENTSFYFQIILQKKANKDIIENFMHITRPSKIENIDAYNDALNAAKNGEKVTIELSDLNSYTLSIKCKNVEIGFITKTITNNTRTSFQAISPRPGLDWKLSINSEGKVISNYDNLFKAIKEQNSEEAKKLLKYLQDFREKEITDNKTKIEILSLLEKLGFDKSTNEILNNKKVNSFYAIMNDIAKIIFNKNIINKPDIEYFESYQNWLNKTYKNYEKTNEIENLIKEGKIINVDIKQIGNIYPNFTVEREVEDIASQPFNSKDFTVFGVDKNGNAITETKNEKFNPITIFHKGEMGILLNNFNGNPIIAKFKESNTVKSSEVINKLVHDELTKLFTDYMNNNLDYEYLYNQLKEILITNPLFYGYKIIKNKKGILITKGSIKYWEKSASKEDKNIIAIIYKESRNGKEKRAITRFNKEGRPYANVIDEIRAPYSEYNPKYIENLVNDILKGLYFNMSMMPLTYKGERNFKNNSHFYKENNKLYLEFGDTKLEYDNYLDFIKAHNCFKVNVKADDNGNFFTQTSNDKAIYISTYEIKLDEKSNYNSESAINESIKIIEKATKSKSVSTSDILQTFGYDQDYINFLLNPLDKNTVSILSDKIYYDKNTKANYDAVFSKGKIIISSRGINQIRKNPNNLIRLMAHENIHKHIKKLDTFDSERIIEDLLDTYNQFIKALENDIANNNQEAIKLMQWVKHNNFYPDNKFIKEDINNRNFTEEWLIESLTRPEISNYLNKIKYQGTIETGTEMTLFQKIIITLCELLGFDLQTLNKNSILAKQFTIFNVKNNNETNSITINNNSEAIINSPVEGEEQTKPIIETEDNSSNGDALQEDINDLDEGIFTEEELDDLLNDEDMYSSTLELSENESITEYNINIFADNNNVNTEGYTIVSDMQKFIQQYPMKYRPILQEKLDDGTFKFICQ